MSARAVLNAPQPQTSFTDLHRELAPAVLEKCRELVAEYSALAKADPAAFPFSESALLDWYADMKSRVAHPIVMHHCENHAAPMPRRIQRHKIAA
jgi:hypothetical protein